MAKRVFGMFSLLSVLYAQILAAPSSLGGKGLWRVLSGDTEGGGAVSVGLHTQSWGKKYEHSYGVNRHTEIVGYFGAGYCPWEILGLNLTIPVNSYLDTEPESQKKVGLGDLRLSVALSHSLTKLLKIGASAYSLFPTGKEGVDFSETGEPFTNEAVQLGGKGLITADFEDRGQFPPFRLHLNVGYHHNYAEVRWGDEDLNEYLALGLGIELPTSPLTPFLELTSEQHIYNDTMGVSQSPMRLTPGLRFSKSSFDIDLAWDINISSELPNREKTEPYDWRLLLGLAWVRAPEKLPADGSIAGRVTDFDSGEPVSASISFPGKNLASLRSDPLTGSFSSEGIPAGLLTVRVEKEGYEEEIAPLFVKGGEVVVRDFALKRVGREGRVVGKAADGLSGEPIEAIVALGEFEAQCDSEGNFEITLSPGEYSFRAFCQGYLDKVDTLTIRAGEEVVFQLSLGRKGPTTIEGVAFQKGEADLLPESRPALERAAQFLKENPELKLEIQGHTDSQGSGSFNLDLSQRRAEAVRACLIEEFGVDPLRLTAKGYGESAPICDNATEEGRRRNRRIDLLFLKE